MATHLSNTCAKWNYEALSLHHLVMFLEGQMKRIRLLWYGPYNVANLSENLEQNVYATDDKHPFLNNYGFYMYLSAQSKVVYIGQAFGRGPRALRDRIRHEVLKENSKLSKDCENFRINKCSLMLKIAHIEEAMSDGNQIQHNPELMNDVEMALIHEMKPLMNKHGKARYRRGNIEIVNKFSFKPLPKRIEKTCAHHHGNDK